MNESTHRSIMLMVLAAFAVLLIPIIGAAQSGTRTQSTSAPGKPQPRDDLRPESIRQRQFKMLEMEREGARPRTAKEQKLALEQISEDHREIQLVNNKMLGLVIPAPQPNLSTIPQSLSEIRRRAIRLKEILGFAQFDLPGSPKEKHKAANNIADLKSNLLALDDSIMRFVQSPIFKNPEVVNVKEAAKASEELEFIIARSQLISKDTERLHKSSGKK